MKRSGSASLSGLFPVKRQGSGVKKAEGVKKADGHGRDARSYGLAAPGKSGGSKSMSLDDMLGEPPSQQEVTSPPPRPLAAPPQFSLASPKASPTRLQDPALLSSPFAAWRTQSFEAELDSQPSSRGRVLPLDDLLCQLATPGAAGPAGASGSPAAQPCQPENDENLNWLVSPVRPMRRTAPAVLQTPEKEGLLPIQHMPSLSSWMVPATRPPPRQERASALPAGALDDVAANLAFNPAQPRELEQPPSPLDRLLAEMGDTDFAATVALWDKQQ